MGTYLELDENTMGTRKTPQHPHFTTKGKKKTWAPGCMLPHLIGCKNVLAHLYSCHFWPSLMVGAMNYGRIVPSTLALPKKKKNLPNKPLNLIQPVT
jgi:hypothetical protein